MDYDYLARMAKTASNLKGMRINTPFLERVVVANKRNERTEINSYELSAPCRDIIEQALIAEVERYQHRVKAYVSGDPDANVLYKN